MAFIKDEWENLEQQPEYKRALKVVIKQQIHTLCVKLADVGEELLLLTANAVDGTFSRLGSVKGEQFLEEKTNLEWQFLGFCNGISTQDESSSANLQPLNCNQENNTASVLESGIHHELSKQSSTQETTSQNSYVDEDLDETTGLLRPKQEIEDNAMKAGQLQSPARTIEPDTVAESAYERTESYGQPPESSAYVGRDQKPMDLTSAGTLTQVNSNHVENGVSVNSVQGRLQFQANTTFLPQTCKRYIITRDRRLGELGRQSFQSTSDLPLQLGFGAVHLKKGLVRRRVKTTPIRRPQSMRSSASFWNNYENITSAERKDVPSVNQQQNNSEDPQHITSLMKLANKILPNKKFQTDITNDDRPFDMNIWTEADKLGTEKLSIDSSGEALFPTTLFDVASLDDDRSNNGAESLIHDKEQMDSMLLHETDGTNLNSESGQDQGNESWSTDVSAALSSTDFGDRKETGGGETLNHCYLCGKSFLSHRVLSRHLKVHFGFKPHRCEVCGASFRTSTQLKVHFRIHSGEKPFACNLCEKQFRTKSNLVIHMRHHSGDKPHKCPVCGSAFTQNCDLQIHLRTHSGEKPFKCDLCDKAFARKYSLRQHQATHVRSRLYDGTLSNR